MNSSIPAFTPLYAYKNSLTAPSSFFTLDPVLPSAMNKPKSNTAAVDRASKTDHGLKSLGSMAPQQVYDCFNVCDTGHLKSVDTLFDQGVWIGYLAEESRSTRYRSLPSFRELEDNYQDLFPTPLPDSQCSDREAVCRGCFGDKSVILQLREIAFGSHGKVVVMPLEGADDAGLFCIMLPQPLDRSIKSLETFRPFEHRLERDDDRVFANNYMLLTLRDRKNNSGLLETVRDTLDSAELTRTTHRPGRLRPVSTPTKQPLTKPATERDPLTEGLPSNSKRKQRQSVDDNGSSLNSAKRRKPVALKGPRMNAHIVQLSDDDFAEPLSVPGARKSSSRVRMQQQTPMSPSTAHPEAPVQTNTPSTNDFSTFHFTDSQAKRIQFVWKVDFEGLELEVKRCLNTTRTFHGLLDSLREEAKVVPSACRQMKATIWIAKSKLPDGTSKAVVVNTSSPDSELNFEGLLRHLVEKQACEKDSNNVVEVELKVLMSSGDNG